MLGAILVGSDGTEPRGVCSFVAGDGGLFPLDPNLGGTLSYSCDPDFPLVTFYVTLVGLALSIPVYFIPRVLLFILDPVGRLRAACRRTGTRASGEAGVE